jgi:hypothetical protein
VLALSTLPLLHATFVNEISTIFKYRMTFSFLPSGRKESFQLYFLIFGFNMPDFLYEVTIFHRHYLDTPSYHGSSLSIDWITET